ncbi:MULTISPECIES: YbjO family protein [Erwinia]|uniref:YbjO family protein n=1 Tax=Erwinia TaxID=551 RepID=UPI000553AD45|nr:MULTISPECIES: YbjO family protein [Erwinia]
MSDVLRESKAVLHASATIPVQVLIAGIAIIAMRCLSVALQVGELGLDELMNFLHRSAQAWDSTLIFIASQLMFFIELRCAIALMYGRNWGRWGYALTQLIKLFYMFIASMGWSYPEIFSIHGENNLQIVNVLISQTLPDLLVLFLLFCPASSRRFFRPH